MRGRAPRQRCPAEGRLVMDMTRWEAAQLEFERQLSSWCPRIAPEDVACWLREAKATAKSPALLGWAAEELNFRRWARQIEEEHGDEYREAVRSRGQLITLARQVLPSWISELESHRSLYPNVTDDAGVCALKRIDEAIKLAPLPTLLARGFDPDHPGDQEVEALWQMFRKLTGIDSYSRKGPATLWIALAIRAVGWRYTTSPGAVATALDRCKVKRRPVPQVNAA
jgi:hypothetical protein